MKVSWDQALKIGMLINPFSGDNGWQGRYTRSILSSCLPVVPAFRSSLIGVALKILYWSPCKLSSSEPWKSWWTSSSWDLNGWQIRIRFFQWPFWLIGFRMAKFVTSHSCLPVFVLFALFTICV
jgi:hypothetical protein